MTSAIQSGSKQIDFCMEYSNRKSLGITVKPDLLVKAPKGCIEYVIIHELCHLIHHDHTQKFIDLQTKEMQDWEKWKMKLEKLLD